MTKKKTHTEILPGLTIATGLEHLIDIDAVIERALSRTGPMTLEDFGGNQLDYDNYLAGLRVVEHIEKLTEPTESVKQILAADATEEWTTFTTVEEFHEFLNDTKPSDTD